MTVPEPYDYPKTRKRAWKPPASRLTPYKESEELTGYVRGQDASDIEERFARALDRFEVPFEFRQFFFAPIRTIPGADEVDFIAYPIGAVQPVEIDGFFAHKSNSQKAEDLARDAVLNEYLGKYGYARVIRIPNGVEFLHGVLDSQESADRLVEELFT